MIALLPRKMRGFSLTELLIVLVMASILAAIAVPSYRQYVVRTHRTVAKTAMQDLSARQESYLVDHKKYATTIAQLGFGSGTSTTAYVTREGTISSSTADALYTLTLYGGDGTLSTCTGLTGSPSATAFRIGASVYSGRPPDTACGTLCLSSTNERGSSIGTVASCWGR